MKKILLLVFLCVFLSYSLTVSAHSGKTDSNGGHTDYSNGDYHYHHGYPAHDHYDMDDDGIKDCPYKFNDNIFNDNAEHTSITLIDRFLENPGLNIICLLICETFLAPIIYYYIKTFFLWLASKLLLKKDIDDESTLYKVIKVIAIILAGVVSPALCLFLV